MFLCGCGKEAAPPPEPPLHVHIAPEAVAVQKPELENLMNVGWGAAVVSRTAELTLENSAIRAIDGDAESLWASPPLDPLQTLEFSFPAPVRIQKIGIRAPSFPLSTTKALSIESSTDGAVFLPLVSPVLKPSGEVQLFDAVADRARYLRVTIQEGGERFAALQSVHVRGEWLAAPAAPSLAGCWTINGVPAAFSESDGRVSGSIGADKPLHVDGGAAGAVYRLAWTRGPEWGYSLVTLTPSGERLSGMTWHEDAAAHSYGTSWFGEKKSCPPQSTSGDDVMAAFFERAGWYPLFSLQFDSNDALIEDSSRGGLDAIARALTRLKSQRIRLLGREYDEATAEKNRRRADRRLQSLRAALTRRGLDVSRFDFVALGSDSPRRPTATKPMRLLYGVVEIESAAPARSSI